MPRPPFVLLTNRSEDAMQVSKGPGCFSDTLDGILANLRHTVLTEVSRSAAKPGNGTCASAEATFCTCAENGHASFEAKKAVANGAAETSPLQELVNVDETPSAPPRLQKSVSFGGLPPARSPGDPPQRKVSRSSSSLSQSLAERFAAAESAVSQKSNATHNGDDLRGHTTSFNSNKKNLAMEGLGTAYEGLFTFHDNSHTAVHLSCSLRETDSFGITLARTLWQSFKETCILRPLLALDGFMGAVIMLNAFVVGISSDSADWPGWILVDIVFCFAYCVEMSLKLFKMGLKGYFTNDTYYHIMDSILLPCAILEITFHYAFTSGHIFKGTSLFRMARLLRLTKLLRVCKLHIVSDLVMMINGAIGGLKTLLWSAIVISCPLFLVALILRETLGNEVGDENGAASFSSLPKAFFTLYRCVVVGDCADETGRPIFVLASAEYGWAYAALYAATFLFMTFGLFNVIVAIYVENTLAAAKSNELKIKEGRLRDFEVFKSKALELAMLIYSFKQGTSVATILTEQPEWQTIVDMEITRSEFETICRDPGFCDLLSELDITPENQKDLFDTLDSDRGGSLDILEIIDGISKLRGDARKSDVVSILLSCRHITELLGETFVILDKHTAALQLLRQHALNGGAASPS